MKKLNKGVSTLTRRQDKRPVQCSEGAAASEDFRQEMWRMRERRRKTNRESERATHTERERKKETGENKLREGVG